MQHCNTVDTDIKTGTSHIQFKVSTKYFTHTQKKSKAVLKMCHSV